MVPKKIECSGQTLYLIGPIHKLRRKWSVEITVPGSQSDKKAKKTYLSPNVVRFWIILLKVMSELIKFLSLSNPLELCSHPFPSRLCRPGGINEDPTIWLDGTRPSPKYIFKNNMSLTNSKNLLTCTLHYLCTCWYALDLNILCLFVKRMIFKVSYGYRG